jgi:hypothetical protein
VYPRRTHASQTVAREAVCMPSKPCTLGTSAPFTSPTEASSAPSTALHTCPCFRPPTLTRNPHPRLIRGSRSSARPSGPSAPLRAAIWKGLLYQFLQGKRAKKTVLKFCDFAVRNGTRSQPPHNHRNQEPRRGRRARPSCPVMCANPSCSILALSKRFIRILMSCME